jgi:hypothetical protein
VVKALDVKDKRLHMYAGVNLAQDTTVDVHYLVPGKTVTTDVARNLGVVDSASVNTVLTTFDVGPLVEVTGKVKANAATAAPWQLVGVTCPTKECATLGVTKADGSFDILTTPGTAHDFHIGGVITDRTFPAGSATIDPVQLVPTGAKAISYASAPQTWFTPRSAVNVFGQGLWAWTGGSLTSAPLTWQRQVATGSAKSGLGAYSGWTTTTSASHSVLLNAGKSVCVRVRTLAFFAPIGGSGLGPAVTQCQAAPLDERSLTYKGSWTKSTNANDYAGTVSTARSKGASLTLAGASGHGVGVVWTRQPTGGIAIVTVNGVRVLSINTKGKTAHQKVAIKGLAAFKKAKVVVSTLSGAPTAIDGVAVLP